MDKFIAKSNISNQILKSAQLSTNLPVNTLIYGEDGVGKKLLSREILPNAVSFDAKEFESLLNKSLVSIDQYSQIILYHIDQVLNVEEFLGNLKSTKIVATAFEKSNRFNNNFAVKIEIPPLKDRPEDLDELIDMYKKEACSIFADGILCDNKILTLDLSKNGKSLKNSIYKSVLTHTIKEDEIKNILEHYFQHQLKEKATYKDLIEVFEIPLLKASHKLFKSQVQMASNLDINRITLRKKLDLYNGEL
ncbi:MAG TPA: Fis family transcriptional regulator [Arcobacter sp.]|jgi:DNA-binding NtrC family response regulator|nr:Fis family transcriptional regulator [Arcobacter sp.]